MQTIPQKIGENRDNNIGPWSELNTKIRKVSTPADAHGAEVRVAGLKMSVSKR
jgi:hypothetical protein